MADDDGRRLSNLELRVELDSKRHAERLDDLADESDRRFAELVQIIRDEVATHQRLIEANAATLEVRLGARIDKVEATARPYHVSLGVVAGGLVVALIALLFSVLTTKDAKLTPQLPPAHSSREQKER